MSSVDVVIPTHDTRELTLRCLRALQTQASDVAVRCIVVDNASADGTADGVDRLLPNVLVVRNERDVGYGAAVNRGVRAGSSELLLILNSDVTARPDAVARLARFLDRSPGVVVAAGRLVDEGTDHAQVGFAMRSFPSLAGQLALLLGLERFWPSNPVSRRQAQRDFDYSRTQETEAQPAGACLMLRRPDFEAVDGFDEGFYYWFEDVDLVRRLRERGRIAYVCDAVFDHVGGATFGQWSRSDVILARYHGLLRYFRKHHPHREVVALRGAVALLAALRALLLVPVDRRRARAYAAVVGLALRPAD